MGKKNYRELKALAPDDEFVIRLRTILAESSLMGKFTSEEIRLLTKYFEACEAPEEAVIFVEGDCAGYLCLVIDGCLHVIKESSHGISRKIGEVCAGDWVGEMSVIDGQPNSATVLASEKTRLVLLTRERLRRLVEENPKVGAKLLSRVAEILSLRLRRTSGSLVDRME